MPKPKDDSDRQIQERIRNALTTLNSYRAKDIGNARIEWVMTQLERIDELLDSDSSSDKNVWLTHQDLRELDFQHVEGTPYENNTQLERELQSIRNFVENRF
jgi:hypothetical protein